MCLVGVFGVSCVRGFTFLCLVRENFLGVLVGVPRGAKSRRVDGTFVGHLATHLALPLSSFQRARGGRSEH